MLETGAFDLDHEHLVFESGVWVCFIVTRRCLTVLESDSELVLEFLD